ncbi:MAG: hypothetical protein AAFV25_04810, partial [Bacteroidota bacterium]
AQKKFELPAGTRIHLKIQKSAYQTSIAKTKRPHLFWGPDTNIRYYELSVEGEGLLLQKCCMKESD